MGFYTESNLVAMHHFVTEASLLVGIQDFGCLALYFIYHRVIWQPT